MTLTKNRGRGGQLLLTRQPTKAVFLNDHQEGVSAPWFTEKAESGSLAGFGIDGLVKVDPQDAGKKCDCGGGRQEQQGGADDYFRDPPSRQDPQRHRDWRHNQNAHRETEVHSAEKVARLPLEPEVTDGAALAHLRESAENGIVKDSADAAAGTALLKNASQR